MSHLVHETQYRSADAMARMRNVRVTVCGAGALGANVLETLARAGFERLRVVDRDRVEERNLATQPYCLSDVGAQKATVLANALYRAVEVDVDARAQELTERNASRLLADSDLVVDTFDNTSSRALVQETVRSMELPCLHAGLASDYGEVLWDSGYTVPNPKGQDLCDYPLARTLVLLTANIAAEVIAAWALDAEERSFSITLRDLSIRPFV